MPITAIVEFSPTEGLDPRESYDRLTRELNDGEPMTRRSQWNDGLLAHSYLPGYRDANLDLVVLCSSVAAC